MAAAAAMATLAGGQGRRLAAPAGATMGLFGAGPFAVQTAGVRADAVTGGGGLSDGALIAIIVGGLVAVAVALSLLTWRYWVATRPGRAPLDAPGIDRRDGR